MLKKTMLILFFAAMLAPLTGCPDTPEPSQQDRTNNVEDRADRDSEEGGQANVIDN